jgi:hypothetical protein
MTVVHKVNEEFTEAGRGIDIDLAFYIDDLDAVLVVVV